MGREDLGLVGQQVGQPVRGGVLVAHQVVGVLGAEQVGTTGRAEEQRAAGEDADGPSRPSSPRCRHRSGRRRGG